MTTGIDRQPVSTAEILAEARTRYHVTHFHLVHDAMSGTERRKEGWEELLGSDFVVLQNYEELPIAIAAVIINTLIGTTLPSGAAVSVPTAAPATVESML